jgi:hypothetical protein
MKLHTLCRVLLSPTCLLSYRFPTVPITEKVQQLQILTIDKVKKLQILINYPLFKSEKADMHAAEKLDFV